MNALTRIASIAGQHLTHCRRIVPKQTARPQRIPPGKLASIQKRALVFAQPFEAVFAADHGELNIAADDIWVRSQR